MKYAEYKLRAEAIAAEERAAFDAMREGLDVHRRALVDGAMRVYTYDDKDNPVATFYGVDSGPDSTGHRLNLNVAYPAAHYNISVPAERLRPAHLRWLAEVIATIERWMDGTIDELPPSGLYPPVVRASVHHLNEESDWAVPVPDLLGRKA